MTVHQQLDVKEHCEANGAEDMETIANFHAFKKPEETSTCKILITTSKDTSHESVASITKLLQEPFILNEECSIVIGDSETEFAGKIENSLLHLSEGDTVKVDISMLSSIQQCEESKGLSPITSTGKEFTTAQESKEKKCVSTHDVGEEKDTSVYETRDVIAQESMEGTNMIAHESGETEDANCQDAKESDVNTNDSTEVGGFDTEESKEKRHNYHSGNGYVVEVQLISFEKVPLVTGLTLEEKLNRARHFKELGNKLFQGKNVNMAFKKYSRAIKYLVLFGDHTKLENHIKEEYLKLKSHCYLNIAACQLHYKGCALAVQNCTKALGIEPTNVKALYRRSQAYKQQSEWKLAISDLEKAYGIDQSNKTVQKELQAVRGKVHSLNSDLAKAMSKMFS